MGHTVTLGGDRLGGGKKNRVELRGFNRSTHDLSRIFRSTMAPGTLVPFLKEVALPGDTWDIDLDMDIQTLPTIGALFGSYKIHADIFQVPMRLYQAALHMNMINIGLDMSKIFMPLVTLQANNPNTAGPIDNQQMNPSCIFKYLGVSGLGRATQTSGIAVRQFNAIPWLAYWDIYKNYYANKQEQNGAVIHQAATPITPVPTAAQLFNAIPSGIAIPVGAAAIVTQSYLTNDTSYLRITATGLTGPLSLNQILIDSGSAPVSTVGADYLFTTIQQNVGAGIITISGPKAQTTTIGRVRIAASAGVQQVTPQVTLFPLADIDTMRLNILQAPISAAFTIDNTNLLNPYKLALDQFQTAAGPPVIKNYSTQYSLEGLGVRTYASDIFNNWINSTFIGGVNGITAVTSVNVTANKFTLDELNLSQKVYNMLNRIAVSGGTYNDWIESVYDQQPYSSVENPVYMGGLIKNIVFQEVISTAGINAGEPLGTLAGRGRLGSVNKGGKIIIKCNEPSYIIGLVSIVPNIDYYQGNDWDGNLKTFNDLHKPDLDEIGYQNLITDQMAWFDTVLPSTNAIGTKSAGFQPAWINYMTSYNRVYGHFADINNQNYMVLTRRYDVNVTGGGTTYAIADLTTYIDPAKYNQIFANTAIDAQNFMVQVGMGIEARRKMSAKVIPNL